MQSSDSSVVMTVDYQHIFLKDSAGMVCMDHHAFTSAAQYYAFGISNGLPLQQISETEQHLEIKARAEGVIELYENTGEIDSLFVEYSIHYMDSVKNAWIREYNPGYVAFTPAIVYKDCYGINNSMILNQFTLVMPSGWDNRISAYIPTTVYSIIAPYDRTFFRSKMPTLSYWGGQRINFCTPNYGLSQYNDKISSWMQWL